jgi:predicted porin
MIKITKTLALPTLAISYSLCSIANPLDAKLIGSLDVGLQSKQLSGEINSTNAIEGGISSTSFIGISGTNKINEQSNVIFELTTFLRVDEGDTDVADPNGSDRADSELFSRSAWVGVEGEKGQIKLGRITSQGLINVLRFNPFGASSQTSPMFMHSYMPNVTQPLTTSLSFTDTSWKNSISYSSPVILNTTINLQYSQSDDKTLGDRIGGSFVWGGWPWAAMLSFESTSDGSMTMPAYMPSLAGATPPITFKDMDSYQLGGYYDFKNYKLYSQLLTAHFNAQRANVNTTTDVKTLQLGISIPVTNGAFLASVASSTVNQSWDKSLTRDTLSFGYEYNLSQDATVYSNILYDTVTNQPSGTSYTVGLRYDL